MTCKKVSSAYYGSIISLITSYLSFLKLPPNGQNLHVHNINSELLLSRQNGLYSSMRAVLTVEPHTSYMDGRRRARKLPFKHSLWEVIGMFIRIPLAWFSIWYWSSYTILPALCSDGVIHAEIREGSYDGEAFVAFIEQLLLQMNPRPLPQSVLVMDNCAIHMWRTLPPSALQGKSLVQISVFLPLILYYYPGAYASTIYPHIPLITTPLKQPSHMSRQWSDVMVTRSVLQWKIITSTAFFSFFIRSWHQ